MRLLVKANGVVCQTQVAQNQVASEEQAKRKHLDEVQSDWRKEIEGRATCNVENDGCAGEMPHGEGDLHIL